MPNVTSSEQILALGKRTLELLQRHSALPSPENYELWFGYAAQGDRNLMHALDQAVKDGKASDLEYARLLHARFFAKVSTEDFEEVGTQLNAEMDKLAQALEGAGTDTAAYGRTLKSASDELDSAQLLPPIKAMLRKVTLATHAMETRNKALETQLQSSMGEVEAMRTRMETVRKESLSDALTGLANRRCFDERIRQAIAEATSENKPLSIAMGDVDHFKKFNDTWGHATGDQVLRLVAQCFKTNVKGRDTAARYGGEEFVVVLPETPLASAAIVAQQIRKSVESKKIVNRVSGETLGSITLSLGVAQFAPGESIADLVNRADACLYAAKHAGRNRVLSERELVKDGQVAPRAPAGAKAAAAAPALVETLVVAPAITRSNESLGFERAVRALSRSSALPLRADIDLRHFQRFARWMVIAEPQPEQKKLPLRLVGSGFFEFFGRDLTDADYLDLVDPGIKEMALAGAFAMVSQPCGLWQRTPLSIGPASTTMLEYTAFPITDDKRGVRQMLVFMNHEFNESTGFPKSGQIKETKVWQWIDVGHGVPAASTAEVA